MPATRGVKGGGYHLSKITNDSANGKRGNVIFNECGIESKHNWQPWPLVLPPFIRSQCDHCRGYPTMLTVLSVCHVLFSLCPPSASPTVPTMPTVSMRTLLSVLTCNHLSSSTQSPSYLRRAPSMACLLYSLNPSEYSAHLSCQTLPVLLAVPKLSRSPCSLYLLCMLCGTPAQEASPLGLQTEGMCLPGD